MARDGAAQIVQGVGLVEGGGLEDIIEGALAGRCGAEGIERHAIGVLGGRRLLCRGVAGHGAAGGLHRILRRIHVLKILVVDQVDRQAVLGMGVEQAPVETAIQEGAVQSGLHAQHAVDAAGGVFLGLAVADQEFAQLERVGGLHRRTIDNCLQRIGSVIAQLRPHRRGQEGVVLVEQVSLARAGLIFWREIPAVSW